MRIVVMSDSHMQHHQVPVPDGDLFIHAGDALSSGNLLELSHFNDWLGTLPHKNKLYVPGNHDKPFESDRQAALKTVTNAKVLIDEAFEIEDLKIYGSPWTERYGDWSFMKPDKDLISIWEKIPNELDILITHGPPFGILDALNNGNLCGSRSLFQAVKKKAPSFHIFGHIHEASGVDVVGETTFINACVLDDWYNTSPEKPARVFDV